TLGRRLVDGAKIVRIFGQEIVVRSDLYTIGGLSAHADQAGILNWLKAFKTPPNHTYIVHGEPSNANALANIIKQQLNWPVSIPERFATVTL
ncbi:MAG TPA: MBL fold metallo-hydrolase RNA specificity domain-containing protein, partial [Nitrosomonas sp.]|nr:MBL fold metallo-hydrolase RNA specificity domain-containing protein [Nitrosomonas sp.]